MYIKFTSRNFPLLKILSNGSLYDRKAVSDTPAHYTCSDTQRLQIAKLWRVLPMHASPTDTKLTIPMCYRHIQVSTCIMLQVSTPPFKMKSSSTTLQVRGRIRYYGSTSLDEFFQKNLYCDWVNKEMCK